MFVVKRNGTKEPVNVDKIIKSLTKICAGLNIDATSVAIKVIGGLYDGASTKEVDELMIDTLIWRVNEDPDHSLAGARVLLQSIEKEVANQEIHSFSQSIAVGYKQGRVNSELYEFVKKNSRKLNAAIDHTNDNRYEYFGLKTVHDRYLALHPETRKVIETPQYWLMRVAAGIFTGDVKSTIEFYQILSNHDYFTSTPTLFNSGTNHSQMSSCYLLASPPDDIEGIYGNYRDVALLSKWAGGIGQDYSSVRSEGSLIKGTNGLSNGIIPFLHTLDSSVLAVNQGGKRKGAACVYLETTHGDLMDFLQLRDSTGDPHRRTHNLNLANWIPDEFMRRVKTNQDWTLFSTVDPEVLALNRLHNEEFDIAYRALEAKYEAMEIKPKWYKKIPAQQIWHRMMKTLCETGNGWACWKDAANRTSNQVVPGSPHIVRSSNLCVEILEVVDNENVAVCNLGSIVLDAFVNDDRTIAWERLAKTVRIATTGLNRVIDKNFYPIESAKRSNNAWRPVGLGVMATQDMLRKMRLNFDDAEASALVEQIHAFIYYHALDTSIELAKVEGKFPNYEFSQYARGKLHFDLVNVDPVTPNGINWDTLRAKLATYGARNSLLIAIAPTATIASIVGKGECIEPSHSNLFSRQTLSGEFIQINGDLVRELKSIGMWTDEVKAQLLADEGSVQNITGLSPEVKRLYRTVWEYSMRPLIDLAAKRLPYIDQSQSLNVYMQNPTIGKASSLYMYAWEKGLKTSYYMRSRSATRVEKLASVKAPVFETPPSETEYDINAAIQCSLDNPETCEACQ